MCKSMPLTTFVTQQRLMNIETYTLSRNHISCSLRETSVVSPPPKKHVRFCEYATIVTTPSPLNKIENAEELDQIWYSFDELECFRADARDLCRRMRLDDLESKQCSLALSCGTRGLEQRACLERQRRKYLGVRCVVRAQRKLDSYKLACLSYKCTHWAAELALEEASRDFVRAYMDEPPLKRALHATEPEERNVRRRLA